MTRLLGAALLCARIAFAILIVLGVLFWTGNALALVRVHVMVGLLFVVTLWVIAAIGVVARVSPMFTLRLAVWGALIAWFGMAQTQMMAGGTHWVIQSLHLVIGFVGMGLAETVARRARRVPVTVTPG